MIALPDPVHHCHATLPPRWWVCLKQALNKRNLFGCASQETSTPETPISTLFLTEPLLDKPRPQTTSDNVNQWQLLKTMDDPVRDLPFLLQTMSLHTVTQWVFIYDRATGKSQPYDYGEYSWAFRNDDTTANVAYSPDGKLFAIANSRFFFPKLKATRKNSSTG